MFFWPKQVENAAVWSYPTESAAAFTQNQDHMAWTGLVSIVPFRHVMSKHVQKLDFPILVSFSPNVHVFEVACNQPNEFQLDPRSKNQPDKLSDKPTAWEAMQFTYGLGRRCIPILLGDFSHFVPSCWRCNYYQFRAIKSKLKPANWPKKETVKLLTAAVCWPIFNS